jgi:hypothetical protein
MDNMWDKVKKGLRDGAAISMEKIEEYTKIGKLKIEELSAKRKIERTFMDLGERTFDLVESGSDGSVIVSDLIVQKAQETIKSLRNELIEIQNKIREITEANKKNKDDDSYNDSDDEVNAI